MRLRMGGARKYYTRRTHTVQPGGGGGDIKISTLEKALLGLTAAFLLMTTGYFLGARSAADPYRVDTQYPAAAEIAAQSGIGEKRAADIVADRAANGPFRIPEDLTRVKGIGEGTLAGLIEYITVE